MFDHYGNPIPPYRPRLGVGASLAIGLSIGFSVVIFAALFWFGSNQQRVADQFVVWQYEPSAAIEGYVQGSALSDEGTFLFYASKPVIAPEGTFDEICATHLEDVGILGCYLPSDKTIYLYDVTDDRLAGLEEVVAAHEMLHAAWDRMNSDERAALGILLEAEATKHADDPGFAETLEFYRQAEPGQRLNELHSIVGTEFDDVSAELEEHYATYFSDRSAVVALHVQSNKVFEQQAAAVDALADQIDALAASIESDYAAYNSGYEQLNADIDSFNARADSGNFATQAEFDDERNDLLVRQDALDAAYSAIEARVAQYDALVLQLDALNAAVAQLNEAINIEPHVGAGETG